MEIVPAKGQDPATKIKKSEKHHFDSIGIPEITTSNFAWIAS